MSELLLSQMPVTMPVHSTPTQILVVEDDPDLQRVFEHVADHVDGLGNAVEVGWAPDVSQALLHLNRQPVDLIVSDFQLGDCGTGLFLRDWCEVHRPAVRFAMMSSSPLGRELRDAETPVYFLAKPFTVQQLRDFLWMLLPA